MNIILWQAANEYGIKPTLIQSIKVPLNGFDVGITIVLMGGEIKS